MLPILASRIMRTTIDIDEPILAEIKRLQAREGKSLGRLVSDLLAQSLTQSRTGSAQTAEHGFQWLAKPMRARVDLGDKHAVLDAMDPPRP
jgi:Arc/MetJ family transcription regulator